MTYFADLAPFGFFGGDASAVRSVGWLEAGHPYESGSVGKDDIAALEAFAVHTWQPVVAAGWHNCSLCGLTDDDDPLVRTIHGEQKLLGADNLFVPSGHTMYVAPSLILHYIEAHGYRPPEEFLRAVRAVDPTRPEYVRQCESLWQEIKAKEQSGR